MRTHAVSEGTCPGATRRGSARARRFVMVERVVMVHFRSQQRVAAAEGVVHRGQAKRFYIKETASAER